MGPGEGETAQARVPGHRLRTHPLIGRDDRTQLADEVVAIAPAAEPEQRVRFALDECLSEGDPAGLVATVTELRKHVGLQDRLPRLLHLQRDEFVAAGPLQKHHEGPQTDVGDPAHEHPHVCDAVLGEHLLHFGGHAGEVGAHEVGETLVDLHRSLF